MRLLLLILLLLVPELALARGGDAGIYLFGVPLLFLAAFVISSLTILIVGPIVGLMTWPMLIVGVGAMIWLVIAHPVLLLIPAIPFIVALLICKE